MIVNLGYQKLKHCGLSVPRPTLAPAEWWLPYLSPWVRGDFCSGPVEVSDQGSFVDLMQSNLQRAKNQKPGTTNDSPKNPTREAVEGSEPELTSEHYTSGLSPLAPPQAARSNDLSTYCTNKHNSHHSLPGYLSHDVDTQCWALRGAHCRKSSGRSSFAETFDFVTSSLKNLSFSSSLLTHLLEASQSSYVSC